MDAILEVADLRTVFPTSRGVVTAIDGVTFRLKRGSILGIVGETGSGKSVTLRSVLGLVPYPGRVTNGQVLFEGEDLLQASKKRLRSLRGGTIGLVAQQPWSALHPIFSIRSQFHAALRANGVQERDARDDFARLALKQVGLVDTDRILAGYAHELSGGMAQRVVMAISFALNPTILFADEPTTALDITIQREILDLLKEWSSDPQHSLVLVTHDLGLVAQYCDDVVVMKDGLVQESGSVTKVFRDPESAYSKQLIASASEVD